MRRLTCSISSNISWWLAQMIPIVTKLIAYAAYCGHACSS